MGLPLPKHLSDRLTCQTIHSLLYRDLAPDRGLYFPKTLVKHGDRLGVLFSKKFCQQLDSGNEVLSDDWDGLDDAAYTEVQRLRARRETWKDTRYAGPMADRVKFMWDLHTSAFQRGFWDFTWLLERGIEKGIAWSSDYCAVDEINDLNALQATLCARIEGKQVEYVGDLDQAIYGFAGVDPQQILKILPHDTVETMELSHRLTAPIARTAEYVLSQASWRSQGVIRTEREGGAYHDLDIIENVLTLIRDNPDTYGDAYVIGRTNWLVGKARNMAIEYGMNVANSGEEDLLQQLCRMIVSPTPSLAHSSIPCLTAGYLAAGEYFKRGAKASLNALYAREPNGSMPWREFYQNYGTDRLKRVLAGEWDNWYRERKIDPLKPIVRFDTFHASKGMEAKTVVLLTDITQRVEEEGIADEEIRLAYVATTRGRDHVMPASIDYGWQSRWVAGSGK